MRKLMKPLVGLALAVALIFGSGWAIVSSIKLELRRQHLVRVCQPGETKAGPRSGLHYGVYTHRVKGLDKKSLSTPKGRNRARQICRQHGFNPR